MEQPVFLYRGPEGTLELETDEGRRHEALSGQKVGSATLAPRCIPALLDAHPLAQGDTGG